ncbi:protein TIC 62, chloroplastic isoform X1 [Punica granatum]|uniref:Protein TIC 62, chloroplastic isoform X1 n=1 Tax=Punica granatum TaxID=22663 RepID=A0A6P8DK93_PUNGR|nr:protein TIC 62, chloroplastic isoform X1 [Punica granatum]XP_031394788.1 protein TIC 62, chloroplastic isoform X1 [Punica granatum]XP_031394789.1 protein TIC 62, chloroplastic isoform X1 [Punica granatum]
MDSCSLGALTVPVTPSPCSGFAQKSFLHGQILRLPSSRRHPFARRVKLLQLGRAKSSGGAKYSSVTIKAALKGVDAKEDDLAFVAGATGRVGSRTVRELLNLGFRVRAGVRSAQKAEALIQSVKEMKLEGLQPVEKLELVECDLERPADQIVPALGNASVVICCIGASEKEVFDVTGPCRIDYRATKNLVDAATAMKVNHFILVSSLGTNKIGFPAAILNLFWGVLNWKRKAEEALIASGIPYTIVRPGGMERPTDAYKETHNITLSEEDTLFGGQVSNLQVAELMAVMAKNRSLSYCKVVEVIAETTAPLLPMEELLAKIPSQRAEPRVSDAAEVPVSSPSTVVTSEPPIVPIVEKETPETKSTAPRPLSPYTAYDDLKPPTSPSPTPLGGKKEEAREIPEAISDIVATTTEKEIPEAVSDKVAPTPATGEAKAESSEAQKPQPLSPYTAYADLRPPTSPSPTSSGPKQEVSNSSTSEETINQSLGGNDVANVLASGEEYPSNASASYHSPYFVYDDFKPPCSPSPSAPSPPSPSPTSLDPSGNGAAKPSAPVEPPKDVEDHSEKKPSPLSPYTMYDDLKPPTSPTPSA